MHAWLAVSATIGMGVTFDETAHLTGGYSYWHLNDYRLQPENGNLPQRWGALPLLFLEPRLEPSDVPLAWNRSHVWLMGRYFFFEAGNNTEFMLMVARAAMVVWSAATGLLVYFWSRSLWDSRGALLSLTLFSFSPTTLAHGPLVTSDMCATFCLLAATGAWWSLLQYVTMPRLFVSLVATGAAALAKFSFVLLVPVFLLLLAWRSIAASPWPAGQTKVARQRWPQVGLGVGLGIVHALFAWLVVWAAFGFRYEAFSPATPPASTFFAGWEHVLPEGAAWTRTVQFARDVHFFPEAFLQGFSFVMTASQERGAFLAGNFSTTGWWWFFPYAFLVKSTLTELIATIAIVVLAASQARRVNAREWTRALYPFSPLLAFGLVYACASLTSNLNIGHRHILPLYPILFIFAGSLARASLGRRGALAAFLLVGGTLIESLNVRPHHIAFFNQLVGGPSSGWRHLVDSSLDWGQNVPRLAEWLRVHRLPNENTYVSMFGNDDLAYHGISAKELAPYFSHNPRPHWDELQAGLYCVSATMLQDVYSPFNGEWTIQHEVSYQRLRASIIDASKPAPSALSGVEISPIDSQLLEMHERARFARLCIYLRLKSPVTVLGHNIFVYRLTTEEIRIVTQGSPEAYGKLIGDQLATMRQGN